MAYRKKKLLYAGLIAACFLAGLFVLGAVLLASYIMTGKRQTISEAVNWQKEHYDISFYEEAEKTDYTVPGYEDYLLHVQLLRNPEESGKYIILSHGYTDNRIGSLKYARMYLSLGYHCIIYDLRGHGENQEAFTTYGILEGKDLEKLIEDTRKRYEDLSLLGLHGESLGAATSISVLKYHPRVDFVVADCGFADIENVLKKGIKKSFFSGFLTGLADFGARIRYGYSLKDMRPIDSLNDNKVPVLFIHGADDTFIVPQNSQDMYDRTGGRKDIHLIDGAGHAQSVLKAPEEYREIVEAFLGTES